ncbi:MAG: O-GlcNAc transferase, partial [Tepidisphaeraceae bacterium]
MTPPTTPASTTLQFSLLLIALTLVAYGPALRGGFIWDDDDYVTENVNLRSAEGLSRIWLAPTASPQYYPIVFTTFWVEHQLWGVGASGYHLVNVLLHATAALLLWRVLKSLTVPGAYLAACLFAVHPVHVESVAWISERKNVLSAVFYFAAALAYVACYMPMPRSKNSHAETPKPRSNLYLLSLLLFIAALLSKTVTCSLPAALLLVMWWKHGRLTRGDIASLAPFFLIGFVFAMFTVWLERSHVLAVGPEWDLSLIDRLLLAARAIWFYATKLIFPFG